MSSSAWLGSSTPEGWLWATIDTARGADVQQRPTTDILHHLPLFTLPQACSILVTLAPTGEGMLAGINLEGLTRGSQRYPYTLCKGPKDGF